MTGGMAAVFVLLVALFAGPAFALMFKTPMARATFDKRRARFAEGKLKKDPQTDLIGPHRPFWRNWLLASLIFGVVTAAVMAGLARLGA
ncbi:hypothetical protein [Paracoccus binzhouensis]|uniref:hypothetical protein n=1 Tax=Paracoccus binzhouensis TaxID=2796149 RepID=UPI0018EEFDA5|nr:hypothetical protein [Paracoccus binzhouensis]